MRRTTWVALALGAWLVLAAAATAQTVTLPDAEETVNDVVDTVSSTAEGASGTIEETAGTVTSGSGTLSESGSGTLSESGSGTLSESGSGTLSGSGSGTLSGTGTGTGSSLGETATSSGSGTTSGDSSSTSTSGGSGTSSGAGSSSARSGSGSTGGTTDSRAPRYRSRFDRLPRRLEALLERIELGRNVRENLARLERILASASPRLRARVLRLLRAEIRRLRANGTTRAERVRIERLQLIRRALTRSTAPAPTTTSSAGPPVGAPAPVGGVEHPTEGRVRAGQTGGGILGTEAGGGKGEAQTPALPTPPLPDQPGNIPFTLGLILLALLALGFVGVVAGVTSHLVGRARSG